MKTLQNVYIFPKGNYYCAVCQTICFINHDQRIIFEKPEGHKTYAKYMVCSDQCESIIETNFLQYEDTGLYLVNPVQELVDLPYCNYEDQEG